MKLNPYPQINTIQTKTYKERKKIKIPKKERPKNTKQCALRFNPSYTNQTIPNTKKNQNQTKPKLE